MDCSWICVGLFFQGEPGVMGGLGPAGLRGLQVGVHLSYCNMLMIAPNIDSVTLMSSSL